VLSTHNNLISSFRLDSIEDDGAHGAHIHEGSRIMLIPNLPFASCSPLTAADGHRWSKPMWLIVAGWMGGSLAILDREDTTCQRALMLMNFQKIF
jgi:hypothetical protein